MSNKDILILFGVSMPENRLIHIQKGVSYAELSVTYIARPESVEEHGEHHHA
ncbi:MAG: hypothetical protein WD469_04300 [Paenibacillaceae bacterium]